MIAVNLLTGHLTDRTRARRRVVPIAIAVLVCVSTGALAGGYWLHLRRAHEAASLQRVALVSSEALGRAGAGRAAALESRRAGLMRRLRDAFELEIASAGAVEVLATLSHAVPEDVWLLEVDARGPALLVSGRATRTAAVPELVDRLRDASALGDRVDVETKTGGSDRDEVVEFRVRVGER